MWSRVSALVLVGISQCALAAPSATSSAKTDGSWVSGLTPMQRRQDAPRLESFTPTTEQAKQRLRGVTEPTPPDLLNLAQQGPWYIPFFRPGATGPYDIRQLHAPNTVK